MLYKNICRILGLYLFAFTGMLMIPFIVALYYEFYKAPEFHPQPHSTAAFFQTIIINTLLASFLYMMGRKSQGQLFRREGLAVVVIIWFITAAVAALPFYLSGTLQNYLQAFFESTSGFTTTGATMMHAKQYDPITQAEIPIHTVIRNVIDTEYVYYGTIVPVRDPITQKVLFEGVEAVSKALLFWRSFMQWLGGVGIVVLFVAILPALGVGGRLLFQAEVPGPLKDSLTPRIKETALQIWKIYLGLTLIQMVFLALANPALGGLDLVTISFSTVSTGGFSIRNESIAAYHSPDTEWVIIIFMILGGVNFSLYYYALKGKLYRIYEPEFLLYMVIILVSCSMAVWFLIGTPEEKWPELFQKTFTNTEAIRYGFFQIISALTSTGFVTADYNVWPYTVQVIIFLVTYIGGMSGSTSGGIKIIRHIMLFRIGQYKIESLFRPETVRKFRVGDREVDSGSAIMTLCFFMLVIFFSVLGTFLYVMDGIDPETAMSLVSCNLNNVGIGFRMDGPTNSCAFLSDFSLILSTFLMILGRLEFFAVLAVLVPSFWKKN
jgi:trk system potassium uptake protein